jgi:hypothetical protein
VRATDPSRSRIKRALAALRTCGTQRDGNLFSSNGLEAFQAIQVLKILNPMPAKKASKRR